MPHPPSVGTTSGRANLDRPNSVAAQTIKGSIKYAAALPNLPVRFRRATQIHAYEIFSRSFHQTASLPPAAFVACCASLSEAIPCATIGGTSAILRKGSRR
jgi:hypothetical protein